MARANIPVLAPFLLMRLERDSPCKINLLLNILSQRGDGFHELETVLLPLDLCDQLEFAQTAAGFQFTCSHPDLPTDETNLVCRAARAFQKATGIRDGLRIHLEKKVPLAAGLGGGSGNAATTLRALNEIFQRPLPEAQLRQLAASLGSDVPFFMQARPALGTGRGERISPLEPFPALRGVRVVLVHPGFGVSTAWAYQQLGRYPGALPGRPGRAQELVARLQGGNLEDARGLFYNSLETPVLHTYPLLALFQEFLRQNGAAVAMMSGSGSSTFALAADQTQAEELLERWRGKFGAGFWGRTVAPLSRDHSVTC